MANPIRKLVQLVLDKRSAEKTEKDTKKSLGAIDKGLARLKKSALSLGAALAGAFAIRSVIRFGKELLSVAAESEEIWNRLGQAVENVGVNFARARPEVEAFARAMQDTTRVGDEDFAEILTELITTSGDYRESLRNVAVVADLAAAKQIELRTAAQLVGRAMVGQTGTLTRYGIVVAEGQDAMEVLRETFRGFAANEVEGLSGKVAQLNNEWSDFKQAIGEVLIAGAEGESIIDRLTNAIKRMTEAVVRFQDRVDPIGKFQRDLMADVVALGEDDLALGRKRFEMGQRILQLVREEERLQASIAEKRQRRVVPLSLTADIGALREVQGQIGALQDVIREIDAIREGPPPSPAPPPGDAAETKLTDAQKEGIRITERLRTAQEQYAATVANLQRLLLAGAITQETYARGLLVATGELNAAEIAAQDFANALKDGSEEAETALEGIQSELQTTGQLAQSVGSVIAGAMGSGVGEMAAIKAKQNALMAAEQLVEGFVKSLNPVTAPLAGAHYAAAGKYSAISAGWAALAGATGGFSGGGGGGGGGAASAPSDVGGAASERAEQPGPEVHIHLVGPGFNATNPEVQRVVWAAQREASRRYGNANVKLHREPR